MSDFEKTKQFLIDEQPEHMKILFTGTLNQLLIEYESEIKGALIDLFYSVPSQNDDKDWWPDSLTEAMQKAKILI